MAKNTDQLPFTEIVERVREIARIASDNDRPRARGAVNDVYARKIPAEEDWTFLLVSSAITCDRPVSDGTVTVNTGDSTVQLSSTSLGSANTGWRVKLNDNADVYTLTYVNATTMTINPSLSEGQNIANGAYVAFNPFYALATNFDRFPKNGGFLFYQGGRITAIPEQREQKYYQDYTPQPNSVPAHCRPVTMGTSGVPIYEIVPPPLKAYNLPYEYLKRPEQLRESTAGWVTIDAGSTVVVGSPGFSRFTEAQTGWYFRVDAFGQGADSEWYRIISIAHNSSLTLQTAFGMSGAVSAGYTLCPAPDYPVKVQPAIMFGAITVITADQNDELYQFYNARYTETLSDAKRTFKTRIYPQEVETVFEDFQYRR